MRKILTLMLMVAMSAFLFAQEGAGKAEQGKTGKETSAPAGMEAPKPSPEMERLNKWLVGTWLTEEKFAPAPEWGMPNGGRGKGTNVVKLGPGGLSLINDYKSRNVMGPFAGHGVIYWDPQEKAYKSLWIDSMSGEVETSTGKWEGDDLVFVGEGEWQGKKFQTLGKMTNITPRSYTFTLANSASGEMKEGLSINYKKAGGAGPQTANRY
ncbi:MAG: DUF1579 domain-containing protein [Acidobacteriales bacterium]|nr:DUF1579 domain-containing protein [Terriglobales bacterium]